METILDYISDLTGASIGQLPADGGLVMELSPSSAGERYLDGSGSDTMSLLFLCKSEKQSSALGTLETVCRTLTRKKHHAHEIYNVTVSTYPNYVGKDRDYWIYSCIINLKHYNKEGF